MQALTVYIEIDRRFSILDSSDSREELASSSYMRNSANRAKSLGWDELLDKRLVVILGEPGSGKSWEFRWRCDTIRKSSKFAFLIELERLVSGTIDTVLSPVDQERLK